MDTTSTIKTVIGMVTFIAATVASSAAVSPQGPVHFVASGIVALAPVAVPAPPGAVVLDTINITGTVHLRGAKKPAAKKSWVCSAPGHLMMGPVDSTVRRCEWKLEPTSSPP